MNDTVTLKAVKGLRYATRMMTAGDTFEAKRMDAKVLVAIKKAEYAEAEPVKAQAPRHTPRATQVAPVPVIDPVVESDPQADADESVDAKNPAADLLAQKDSLPFLSFKAAAAKILGSDMESTKADIVAALQLRAEG